MCAGYYQRLQKTIWEESREYLQEISRQISLNVCKIVTDSYAMLGTVEMMLQNSGDVSFSEAQAMAGGQRSYWNYQDLLLIDVQGNMHVKGGEKIALPQGDYLRQVVVGRQRACSASQIVNGCESILFTIPVEGITVDGEAICALGATYRLDTFDQVLTTAAFGGQAYTYIIHEDGTMVVLANAPAGNAMGYNLLSYLEGVPTDKGSSVAQMRADIAAGRSGQIGCTMAGVHNYVIYYAVGAEGWYLTTVVPVAVVNAKSELLLEVTLLFCGFITLTMLALTLLFAFTFLHHKKKLENIAFVDPITGGSTYQRFYVQAEALLQRPSHPQYAVLYTNLEKFRLINEQFGRLSGDGVLIAVEAGIGGDLSPLECIGRIAADNFCVLVAYDTEAALAERFRAWQVAISVQMKQRGIDLLCPPIQFGIYMVPTPAISLPLMVDRAKFALSELANTLMDRIRYAIYEDNVHKMLFREKQLVDRMEKALKGGEFLVYLQPKYLLETDKVGGAEALVRWSSPEEGMIYPDEFIPLFEKNGFVMRLDLWVFEVVCKMIQGWIDTGRTPVKVSVNCSRLHLQKADFIEPYRQIFNRYSIPARYIELELTESMVYENMQRLTAVISEIHQMGFGCAIDDFGSGYSSLNLIQDIPADTLKLDRIFFRTAEHNRGRAHAVVESVVNLAKALSMTTVAEGVECPEQVRMLRGMGCDYVQGYVFARPMPIREFEMLTFGGKP